MNLFLRNVLYSFPLFLPIRLEADIGIPKRYKTYSASRTVQAMGILNMSSDIIQPAALQNDYF